MDSADPLDPNGVHDRDSFFAFVAALAEDRRRDSLAPGGPSGRDAGAWENATIEDFLEAALAWARDTGMGESQGLPSGPSWQAFAAFLLCGKIYE